MKILLKPFQLVFLLLSFGFLSVTAHTRIIKGTVSRDGKPASGVHVTADKSKDSYYTSFDGKYELKVNLKAKWIRFAFSDKEEKLVIDANSGDTIDFGVPAQKPADILPGPVKPNPEHRHHDDKETMIK
jgi:hypothetical protein